MPGRGITARRLAGWLSGRDPLAGALRLRARDREALTWHAHRLLGGGAFAEAGRVYEVLALLWPSCSAEAHLGVGVCRQLEGKLEDAERAYDEVLGRRPDHPYARANRAEVLLLRARKDAARSDLAKAAEVIARGRWPIGLRDRVERLRELASEP